MPPTRHQICRLAVVGGFLDGQKLSFDHQLNTIIGARGTGKTTLLELLRYGLDGLPSDPTSRRRIEDLVARNLRGGRVEIAVQTRDGLEYLITRTPGEDPIITAADGRVINMTVRGGLFRPDMFSQNEVETIADHSRAQLDLLDSFRMEVIGKLSQEIEATRMELQANAGATKPLRERAQILTDELKNLPAIEERLRAFGDEGGADAKAINQAHGLKAMRDREHRALAGARRLVEEVGQQTRALVGRLESGCSGLGLEEFTDSPNAELLRKVHQQIATAATSIDEGLTWMVESLRGLHGEIHESEAALSVAHKEQEVAFQHILEAHEEARGKASERAGLDRTRNDLLAKQRELDQVQSQLQTLATERLQLLDQLWSQRDERYRQRSEIAAHITERVAPAVRVTIAQFGDRGEYRQLIENALVRTGARPGQVAEKITTSLEPEELVEALRSRNRVILRERASLNENQAEKVLDRLADEDRLAELEAVELVDQPVIELNDNGTWKETAILSTGQKCTAILPILLLDSDTPLLIDQPEDNLDNRFVFEAVVESVRRVKASRQLIFITHNPNIPVLGEAEQVFVMESDGLA
ncbi:MAG: AAA family ATPase, partial [Planctomycetota bacterium]